jgi:hypothetical protein
MSQKFTEPGLSKGRGWFLNFFGGSDDFIMQKVYLLRLMSVSVLMSRPLLRQRSVNFCEHF